MANPTVDKLKTLGLRHGEKAVLGLAAVVCLFCLFTAITRETIPTTPDEVKSAAQRATTNINKTEPIANITQKLEAEFLKVPNLVSKVEAIGKDAATRELLAFVPPPLVTPPARCRPAAIGIEG